MRKVETGKPSIAGGSWRPERRTPNPHAGAGGVLREHERAKRKRQDRVVETMRWIAVTQSAAVFLRVLFLSTFVGGGARLINTDDLAMKIDDDAEPQHA